MTLNEYQEQAMVTRMPSCNNFSYMFLNLVGEMGEFASKVAKHIRKQNLTIGDLYENQLQFYEKGDNGEALPVAEWQAELRKEAGDILWQLTGLCADFGWTLEEVAQENLAKLADRQKRNTIDGEGDNR